LHLFSKKQPDLNWSNPEVRRAVYEIMRWWLDKGVDGFRMDVINFIAKATGLPDSVLDPATLGPRYAHVPGVEHYADTPRVHEYLQEMQREVLRHYDVMTVGECHFLDPLRAARYAAESRRELCMLFQFDQIFAAGDLRALRRAIEDWYLEFRRQKAWTTLVLGNHDFPRLVSVFGDDGRHREASAKLFATLLLTGPGTPFLYQGDEIGMTNVRFERVEDYDDCQALGQYREHLAQGMAEREAFGRLQHVARDNARTPMQWSAALHAGFTSGTPWLGVNPNYTSINVTADRQHAGSIFRHYQQLLALRKREPALVYGGFTPLLPTQVPYVYARDLGGRRVIVILNWSSETSLLPLAGLFSLDQAELLSSNLEPPAVLRAEGVTLVFRPWQACVNRVRGESPMAPGPVRAV
jgi:oligo-1,6-glucosidase